MNNLIITNMMIVIQHLQHVDHFYDINLIYFNRNTKRMIAAQITI